MKKSDNPKEGELRVWWVPQVPMNAFYIPVNSIHEAKLILSVLANYDIFQFENHVKPDYSNAGGLECYDSNFDGEGNAGWCEWYNDDGRDIDDVDDEGNTIDEDET